MTPFCKLEFDGAASDLVTEHMKDVTINLNTGETPDKIDITLSDPLAQLPRPRAKAKIYCTLGYVGGKSRKHGPFISDEYSSGFETGEGDFLKITGTSADFQSGIKGRATKTHKDTTLGKIIQAEASASNYDAYISSDLASFEYEMFFRGEKSFMQMVSELAETHDAIEKYRDGKVLFMSRSGGISMSGQKLFHTLSRDELEGWNFNEKLRNNYGGVKAATRDHDKGKRKVVKEPLNDSDPWYEHRKLFPNEKIAKTAAKSKAKQLKRDEKTLSITTKIGDPDLLEMIDLTLSGCSPEADQTWVTKSATHTFNAENEAYGSTAECEMKL